MFNLCKGGFETRGRLEVDAQTTTVTVVNIRGCILTVSPGSTTESTELKIDQVRRCSSRPSERSTSFHLFRNHHGKSVVMVEDRWRKNKSREHSHHSEKHRAKISPENKSQLCVHTGCARWPYVTHLATCFSEQDTAAVRDDAKRRAAHLHLFSTRTYIHTRAHATFMGFNGPELSLAWRKSRKVTQAGGGGGQGRGLNYWT